MNSFKHLMRTISLNSENSTKKFTRKLDDYEPIDNLAIEANKELLCQNIDDNDDENEKLLVNDDSHCPKEIYSLEGYQNSGIIDRQG